MIFFLPIQPIEELVNHRIPVSEDSITRRVLTDCLSLYRAENDDCCHHCCVETRGLGFLLREVTTFNGALSA